MFEYAIKELTNIKLAFERIAKSPINNAISENAKIRAKELIPELQQAISILKKAGETSQK